MTQSLIHKRTSQPFGVFQASPSYLTECEWCGHAVSEHTKDGCEHDRKIWFDGIEVDAPCGCDAVRAEPAPQIPIQVAISGRMLALALGCIGTVLLIGGYLIIKDLTLPVNW